MFPPYELSQVQLQQLLEAKRREDLWRQTLAKALQQTMPKSPVATQTYAAQQSYTNAFGRYREADHGRFVTEEFAQLHPRRTEFDHMQRPSITNGPTRYVHQRVDNGQWCSEEFAMRHKEITVRTRVPVKKP